MNMQRLSTLGVAFLFLTVVVVQETASQGNSGKDGDETRCFLKADVPFGSKNDAKTWVDHYCQCFEKVLACKNAKCITELWDFMHADDALVISADGYEYPHWRVWNAKMQKGARFLKDSSGYSLCELSSYGPDYVMVDETFEFYFTLSVPVLGEKKVTYAQVETHQRITFNKDGIFLVKEHNTGGVYLTMNDFFDGVKENAQSVATSFVAATVPQSVADSFSLADADSGIIAFVGCVALVMYLSLLYTIIRVATLCIRGGASSKFRSGAGYQYDKVNDLMTTVTEIEDDNEKQVLT